MHRQLNGPFDNLAGCLPIIQYLTQSQRCVNLNLVCLKVMGELVGYDWSCIGKFHDMKMLRLGVAQHFTDKVYWVLDLAIGI
jgi:hypothetical protein